MANNQQLLMGEGAGGAPVVYVEDVFSTYLYTGNDTTNNINNGIDLSTKGGLVWMKSRSSATSNFLCDTARGREYYLLSNATNAQSGPSSANRDLATFNTNGFTLGLGAYSDTNYTGVTYASWTFREQPKFFDVVTYTGDGTSNRAISHSLTSTPGCIIVKRTDTTSAWYVYHRGVDASYPELYYMLLNTTDARAGAPAVWDVAPTSTNFTIQPSINVSAGTYVAYIYAHNAGGFGLAGTDNVISCGSAVVNGSGAISVTLGYEPQWVLLKNATTAGNWFLQDSMRGYTVQTNNPTLKPNLSDAETSNGYSQPNATGFSTPNGTLGSGDTYIYIAIRRGPMKVPTVGTSVYSPQIWSGDGTSNRIITGANFAPDMAMLKGRSGSGANYDWLLNDRLRGNAYLITTQTASENPSALFGFIQLNMNGGTLGSNTTAYQNVSGQTFAGWFFGRAPGFFDEVCYTGTGSATTFTHNLGTVPEMMIVKWRTGDAGEYWYVYHASLGVNSAINLNLSDPSSAFSITNGVAPTSSVFTISGGGRNTASATYVNYLFATCAGVSKVGGYTGNGSSQTIACGFTAGSRFVLIKRTDSTGDWYVWDSARGIIAGNDPHLSVNTTAAEVTTDDSVDTDNSGFIVNQLSATNINVTSATYIFLAIA